MKKGTSFWFVMGGLVVVSFFIVGMRYPAPLYSPGDLASAHSKTRCKDCHAPFKKVPSESCSTAKCHPDGKTGKKLSIKDLHTRVKGKDCLACHTDHKGVGAKITKAMNHDTFARDSRCVDCHIGPKDKLHVAAQGSCADCHGTKAWKPSTYNHDKYFFLDKDHMVSCNKCHDTGSYKKYTCLNCHEHSTRGIISEHREEGIRNFGDCLRCHQVTMNVNGTRRQYGTPKVDEGFDGKGEGRRHDDDDD
ncbi:MAG: cytochrome c3 family protein [Nitrospirota bacterium]|nr:cytochrome c3 family protein [Nitrospirota bacterium]